MRAFNQEMVSPLAAATLWNHDFTLQIDEEPRTDHIRCHISVKQVAELKLSLRDMAKGVTEGNTICSREAHSDASDS
jgi:hypothetical protein